MGYVFNAAASIIVAAKEKEYLELLEILYRAALQTLKGHTDSVSAVAFLPDVKSVASASAS